MPSVPLRSLIEKAKRVGTTLIVGEDVNAHYILWGSTDTNEGGEILPEHLLGTELAICTRGNGPSSVTRSRQYDIDVTFTMEDVYGMIREWSVLAENSFSDHK